MKPEKIDSADAWDKWRKPEQTKADYIKEVEEAKMSHDGQMQVKRTLEANGLIYNPCLHADLDLEWGVHNA